MSLSNLLPTATISFVPAPTHAPEPAATLSTPSGRDFTQGQLVAWLVLQIWPSHIGLPVIVATVMLCNKISRHPVFTNLCCAWIFIGIASSLLLYAGQAIGSEPSQGICLAQASLLTGSPAVMAIAVFLLILQMSTSVLGALTQEIGSIYRETRLRMLLMLAVPWIFWLATIVASLVIGVRNPSKVSRNFRFFYCSIDSDPLAQTIEIFSGVILALTLVLGIFTASKLYLRWKNARQEALKLGALEVRLAIRTATFGLLVVLMIGLDVFGTIGSLSLYHDLIMACSGSIIVLIFGSQPDILRAVFLCGTHREPRMRLADDEEHLKAAESSNSFISVT